MLCSSLWIRRRAATHRGSERVTVQLILQSPGQQLAVPEVNYEQHYLGEHLPDLEASKDNQELLPESI